MPKTTVYSELLEATGVKAPKNSRNRQGFLESVSQAVHDLAEDDWANLSEEAQRWYNTAAKAIKANRDIPELPGAPKEDDEAPRGRRASREDDEETGERSSSDEEEAGAEEEAEPERSTRSRGRSARDETEEEDMPAKNTKSKTSKTSKANGASRSAGRSAAPAKAARGGGGGGVGIPTVIMKMLAKNPELSKEDLVDALKDKGLKCSPLTVGQVRSTFRSATRVLQDAGKLKQDMLD